MAEDDFDDWLAGLSGKRRSRGKDDEAAALREALRGPSSDVNSEGGDYSARIDDLSGARLLKRLRDEGLEPPGTRPAINARRWAVAASVVFVAIAGTLVWQPWQPNGGLVDISRGAVGGLKIFSATPDIEARRIITELGILGLRPKESTGKDRVTIDVSVSTERLPSFGGWMERQGGVARTPGVYRIVIETRP
jgi:hypothetical protein